MLRMKMDATVPLLVEGNPHPGGGRRCGLRASLLLSACLLWPAAGQAGNGASAAEA